MSWHQYIISSLLFIILNNVPNILSAQMGGVRGNEWIRYEQTYRKIEVAQDGIYRLTPSQFGIPSNVNPVYVHLMYLGEEQPIYVHNEGDPAKFDDTDYLEFYGQRHDARTEKPLYRHPTKNTGGNNLQPNPYFNTMSDTSAYFLTWDNIPRADAFTINDYQTDDETLNKLPVLSHYRYTELWYGSLSFPSWYSLGGRTPQYDSYREGNCAYTTGEGYTHRPFPGYGVPNFTYRFPSKYPANNPASNPKISAYVHPFSPAASQVIDFSYGNKKFSASIGADTMTMIEAELLPEDLDTISFNFFTISSKLPNFQVDLGYAKLEYDRRFQFDGESFIPLQWNDRQDKPYKIVVAGLNISETNTFYLYDLKLKFRTKGRIVDGKVIFPIIAEKGERSFILVSDKRITDDSQKAKIFFTTNIKKYQQAEGAEFVIIAHPGVINSARKYAEYRDTCSVNRLSTMVVLTEEIYDEFSYGSPNVMGIKRFVRTAIDSWKVKPKYLFLWGKGWYARLGNELKTPTWGSPASDNRFVCQFNEDAGMNYLPEISVGRVNVMNEAEGYAYLEKVKEYEHTPYQEWMKAALHLGGGEGAGEQRGIIQNLTTVQKVFEDAPLGGKVTYFQKGNVPGAPVQPQTTSIKEVMKNGIGVFCFYGHSSPGLFDVEVLHPSEYENYGKYPFIIANGCYAGDFNNANTLGEKFLTEPKRGAIGWLASSSYGYATQLSRYNQHFYEIAFRDSLGMRVGDIVRETARRFLQIPNLTQNDYVHVAQVNLQGDPSIRLYHPKAPDLELLRTDVKVTPDKPTMQTSELDFQIRLRNIGSAFSDSFVVSVKHNLPDGRLNPIILPLHAPVLRSDTLYFKIQLPNPAIGGTHRFEITLDSDNRIAEMNESNNRFTVDVILPTDLPQILYPAPYMITNRQLVYLSASAPGRGGEKEILYQFEADTTPDFNSPFKMISPSIKGTSDLGQWELPTRLKQNTVYFWRVRFADKSEWAVSSFKYMMNRTGWAQAHQGQWINNASISEQIEYDTPNHHWEFKPFSIDITARAGYNVEFNIDGGVNGYTNINATYQNQSVLYSIIDGKSLRSKTYTQQYNYLDFIHYTNISKLEQVVEGMNEGDHIVLLGHQPYTTKWKWDSTAKMKTLHSIGATEEILKTDDADGFIVLGTKGAKPGTALTVIKHRILGRDSGAYISTKLYSKLPEGKIHSPWFGPAKSQWLAVESRFTVTKNEEPSDQVMIHVIGRDEGGNEKRIKSSTDKWIDLTDISPIQYKFLRLEAELKDSVHRTAPQPDFWHVYYDELPDGIMIPQPLAVSPIELIEEGDTLIYKCNFRNITPIRMDSLNIRCAMEDVNGRIVFTETRPFGNLQEWGQLPYTFKHSTRRLKGLYRLVLTVNPDYLKPEKTIDNNICIHLFNVMPDLRPPILEVMVEKKRPTDGMIVSPNPEIIIRLKDDNKFEVPNDTTAVDVWFGLFGGSQQVKKMTYSSSLLKLVSKESDGVQISFNPQNLADGRYELQVQGWDKARNPAGINPYIIHLEVRNATSVGEVINLPNPFTDQTYFSYLLTGDVLPTEFKIDIFDLSGRKIRTLDLAESGDIQFGLNITRSSWDGTDANGKSFAEGVYIYRARIRFPDSLQVNGENLIEKQGKIILLR